MKFIERSAFALFLLILFFACISTVPALAKDVLISWDGMSGTVAGYKVYWGQASRAYESSADAGTRSEYIVRGLQDGTTYYFATTAYDSNHNESDFSNEAVVFSSTAPPASSGLGGSCFIATAAYGSNLAPEVQILREFRDAQLMTNPAGRFMVNAYYKVSPPIADVIRDNTFLRALTRWIISPAVYAVKNPITALLLMALTAAGTFACGRMAGACRGISPSKDQDKSC